jgi:hypothetical protein
LLSFKRHKSNKDLYSKASGIFLFFLVFFILPLHL